MMPMTSDSTCCYINCLLPNTVFFDSQSAYIATHRKPGLDVKERRGGGLAGRQFGGRGGRAREHAKSSVQ